MEVQPNVLQVQSPKIYIHVFTETCYPLIIYTSQNKSGNCFQAS